MATLAKPNMRICAFTITGTAPYVQCPWTPRTCFRTCAPLPKRRLRYETKEGWAGIPTTAIRHSLIDACRAAGFSIARGKLALFVEADGFDAINGMPLVRITKGEPRVIENTVRIQGMADIRKRACRDPGWEAEVRIRYDDVFVLQDVRNLLARAGMCAGIGKGRPASRDSSGMAWGTFSVKT